MIPYSEPLELGKRKISASTANRPAAWYDGSNRMAPRAGGHVPTGRHLYVMHRVTRCPVDQDAPTRRTRERLGLESSGAQDGGGEEGQAAHDGEGEGVVSSPARA